MYRTIRQEFNSGYSTHEAFHALDASVSAALAQGYQCVGGPYVYTDKGGLTVIAQAVVRPSHEETHS